MKTRTGFVSNSSSSSFIVAFRGLPESVDQLEAVLFHNYRGAIYDSCYCNSATTREIAEQVWADMQKQLANGTVNPDDATLLDVLCMDSSDHVLMTLSIEFSDSTEERNDTYWDRYLTRSAELAELYGKKELELFRASTSDDNVFVFEYGDNHGTVTGNLGSVLETGDIFRSVGDVIKINHH